MNLFSNFVLNLLIFCKVNSMISTQTNATISPILICMQQYELPFVYKGGPTNIKLILFIQTEMSGLTLVSATCITCYFAHSITRSLDAILRTWHHRYTLLVKHLLLIVKKFFQFLNKFPGSNFVLPRCKSKYKLQYLIFSTAPSGQLVLDHSSLLCFVQEIGNSIIIEC